MVNNLNISLYMTGEMFILRFIFVNRYMRSDYFVLGKLPLNIFNLPVSHHGYTELLYDFLSHLVTKSRLLQMSLEVMNSTDMIPK